MDHTVGRTPGHWGECGCHHFAYRTWPGGRRLTGMTPPEIPGALLWVGNPGETFRQPTVTK